MIQKTSHQLKGHTIRSKQNDEKDTKEKTCTQKKEYKRERKEV